MSFLQQQLANVAWAKEQLLKEGYTPEVQEEAFQEDLFFPKSKDELSAALSAVDQQFENKQFDEAKAATLKALLKRAYILYTNAAQELRRDRVAKQKADKAAAKALAKQAQGEKPVVETENVKVKKKDGWWNKNKWFVIGGLALVAITTTVIVVVKNKNKGKGK